MMKTIEIAVLGGDERQIFMACELARKGWQVSVWGLGDCGDRICPARVAETPQDALKGARAVILPVPSSADGVRVSCPLDADASFRLSAIFDIWKEGVLLGGRLPPILQPYGVSSQVRMIDYCDDDLLQLRNALPTAEGAIAIAMRELPVTIDGIFAAVIGYGRIGTVLADKLHALGAHVYLYARKEKDLARAKLRHLTPMRLSTDGDTNSLTNLPKNCRVVFNTVPHPLLHRSVLETFPRNCLYIDLASAPGGIDWAAARELGIHTVWGTALPGKCVPESAGLILAETVDGMLENEVSLC